MRVIGLVGKAGAGKDTVARMIPFGVPHSFASPLKEFCQRVFGWSNEQLWGPSELRSVPDPRYIRPNGEPLTPRYALQLLGTEWGRACCPDIWPRLALRDARQILNYSDGSSVVVFTDCRFVNEAKAIREAGGQVWYIDRVEAGLPGDAGKHSSETEMDSPEMTALVNVRIYNLGTLEALRKTVEGVAESLR